MGFIDVQYNLSLDGRNILSPSQTTWVPICFAFQHLQILKKKVQQSVIRLPYFIQFYTWLALRKEFWKTLNYSNAYGRGILMIYILFRNMEKIDILRQCNETLNGFHLIIKFTAEWSKEEINFLGANLRLRYRQLETDLHIKPTNTHQLLDSISCHPYHFHKSILHSQQFEI